MSEHLGLLEDADHTRCDAPQCWCNALVPRPTPDAQPKEPRQEAPSTAPVRKCSCDPIHKWECDFHDERSAQWMYKKTPHSQPAEAQGQVSEASVNRSLWRTAYQRGEAAMAEKAGQALRSLEPISWENGLARILKFDACNAIDKLAVQPPQDKALRELVAKVPEATRRLIWSLYLMPLEAEQLESLLSRTGVVREDQTPLRELVAKCGWMKDCDFDEAIGKSNYRAPLVYASKEVLLAANPDMKDPECNVFPMRVAIVDAEALESLLPRESGGEK